MVRVVRTERRTSDCDVKCRLIFSFQCMFHVLYGPQPDVFVKVMQDDMACFYLFSSYIITSPPPLDPGSWGDDSSMFHLQR